MHEGAIFPTNRTTTGTVIAFELPYGEPYSGPNIEPNAKSSDRPHRHPSGVPYEAEHEEAPDHTVRGSRG